MKLHSMNISDPEVERNIKLENIKLLEKSGIPDEQINLDYKTTETAESLDNQNSKNMPLMDFLVNQKGYTKYHFMMILFTCFILSIDGIHMCLFSNVYIPFQKLHQLSEFEMSMISSSIFLAIGIGSFLTTFEVIASQRKNSIILSTFLSLIFNLLMGLVTNLYLFITFRFLIGVCIGVMMPMINNLLCEYLPIKFRSFNMVLTGASFYFGSIYLNLIMLYFIPNYEPDKLHYVFLFISIPNLVFTTVLFFKLEESPRYLIINNKIEKGLRIFEKIINRELSSDEKKIIIHQLNRGESGKNIDRSIKSAFKDKYFLITVILMFLWMVNSFVVYGANFSLSLTLKYIEENIKHEHVLKIVESDREIIINQIYIYILSIPGSLVAALMTESKFFGRKMTIFTGFLLVGVFNFLAVVDINHFHIYVGLSGSFNNLSFSGCGCFSPEVYPTKIRDVAVGFLYFCTRISGLVSQFIAIWLFNIHYLAMCYAVVVVCLVACIFTFMLPYDTYQRPLDSDEEEIAQDKNKLLV
jgi:MFS family permease